MSKPAKWNPFMYRGRLPEPGIEKDPRETPLLYVEWYDTNCIHGWERPKPESYAILALNASVGFLLAVSDEYLSIAQSVTNNHKAAEVLNIARTTIVRVERLTVPKRKEQSCQ